MSFWTDTHAHIYAEDFDADREDMFERCLEQNVMKIFMPNVDHTTIDKMLDLESRRKECHAMMGLHPCSVKKGFERELYIVEEWLSKRKFCAIGEMGTDLYWDKTFWHQQCEAFHVQVQWAKKYEVPIVIHCRESLDETIALVEKLQDGKLTGIFHCFGGTVEQAERISKLNFFVGIGGVSTFKKSGLDAVLAGISLDRIVLETDSPYLSPVPHRGKRNEPAYIPLIAQKIADMKKIPLQELQKSTTAHALEIFNMK